MKLEIGGGIIGTLTIVFVILKALGYLNWRWLWVFSPLWIAGLFALGVWIIVLIILLIIDIIKSES